MSLKLQTDIIAPLAGAHGDVVTTETPSEPPRKRHTEHGPPEVVPFYLECLTRGSSAYLLWPRTGMARMNEYKKGNENEENISISFSLYLDSRFVYGIVALDVLTVDGVPGCREESDRG